MPHLHLFRFLLLPLTVPLCVAPVRLDMMEPDTYVSRAVICPLQLINRPLAKMSTRIGPYVLPEPLADALYLDYAGVDGLRDLF